MGARAPIFVIPAACVALAGCGPDSSRAGHPHRPGAPSAHSVAPAGPPLERGVDSESVREIIRNAGIEVPALGVVLRRRGQEILGFRVNSIDAVALWERLRSLIGRTGLYPLIVRDEHGNLLADQGDFVAAPSDVLAAAGRIRADDWFKERLKSFAGDRGVVEGDPYPREPGAMAKPQATFSVPFDIVTGKAVENVFMVLLPTTEGAQAPAWMQFGGWNDCPTPEAHVAVLRRWHEKYGAEIVAMTGDVLELRVPRGVNPPAAALELAKEQYLYCPDIVEQGVDSVDALASTLAHGRIWFFWWD